MLLGKHYLIIIFKDTFFTWYVTFLLHVIYHRSGNKVPSKLNFEGFSLLKFENMSSVCGNHAKQILSHVACYISYSV